MRGLIVALLLLSFACSAQESGAGANRKYTVRSSEGNECTFDVYGTQAVGAESVASMVEACNRKDRGNAILAVTGPTERDLSRMSSTQIQSLRCKDVRDKIEVQKDMQAAGSSGYYNLTQLQKVEIQQCGDNSDESITPDVSVAPNPHVLSNSPELKCGDHRPCSDTEVSEQVQDIYRKWPAMPPEVQAACKSKTTLYDMAGCIELAEISWLGKNPNADRSWFPSSAQ